jgi:hypothetical protein
VTVYGRLSIAMLAGALALGGSLAAPQVASAQPADKPAPAPPPPTPAQLEQAKQAFLEGKTLFDAKKFEPAVEKFKESYRLSRNPVLLYNIAFTLDSMGQKDLALFYYKKFLSDAPATAPQRGEVTARVAVLDKELAAAPAGGGGDTATAGGGDTATGGGDTAAGGGNTGAGDGGTKPTRRKPAVDPASYTADDFQHQIVEDAPPGRPLDLSAFSPEDSGWIVTLFYRGHGEAKFTAVPMKPRYNELVGRVPAAKMTGVSIQYYIEVRTPDAKIVTRVGKPASPNIVYIDAKARPRYYPDLDDTGDIGGGGGSGGGGDYYGGGGGGGGDVAGGWLDAGSTKFNRAKWIATGTGVGMLGVSLTFYMLAASMSSSLEAEATLSNDDDECDANESPPCYRFNNDRKAVETAGKRNELVSRITFGVGLAATGAAAYLWYKEIKAARKSERAAVAKKTGLDSMIATPVVGEGFIGGSAALRF